ncbi:MAG: hypothetical protein ACPGWR_15370 [Ardenticatenaceae bacterium]
MGPLFGFIEWVMKLPEELAYQLDERIAEYEEEQKMPYVTNIEQMGIADWFELGVLKKVRENLQLDKPIAEYKQHQKKPYITSIERMGIQKGLQRGILKALQVRFPNISLPKNLVEKVKSISSEPVLDMLLEHSVTVESVPAFEQKLAELAGKNVQQSASAS